MWDMLGALQTRLGIRTFELAYPQTLVHVVSPLHRRFALPQYVIAGETKARHSRLLGWWFRQLMPPHIGYARNPGHSYTFTPWNHHISDMSAIQDIRTRLPLNHPHIGYVRNPGHSTRLPLNHPHIGYVRNPGHSYTLTPDIGNLTTPPHLSSQQGLSGLCLWWEQLKISDQQQGGSRGRSTQIQALNVKLGEMI
ncbi:hypothetical protein P692DRAFT_201810749 [Suillus brevipes Sb2]|nr:hypothetical protein P692DRAFT_201810749 [Suillus brevipes Sb2]